MTSQLPIPLDLAFVPAGTISIGDLILLIRDDASLTKTRKRDMISGLTRIAKALGLPPTDVPCDGRWLQPRLAKVQPAILDLKPKSWQNAVSDARSAMAHFGIVEERRRHKNDLSEPWRDLWNIVLSSNDPTLNTALIRFVHFLSRQGVQPNRVCDEHASAYRDSLAINEISKDPGVAFRAAVNGWNLAGQRLADWPKQPLTIPSRQVVYSLDPDVFPKCLIEEIGALMTRLALPDPFTDTGKTQGLRPETLKHYRCLIMRFASDLVHSGMEADELTGLDKLLQPQIAERGLRQMLARNDNETCRGIYTTAGLLRNLSKRLQYPEETQQALTVLAAKLTVKPLLGMTAKNRARLRVLQEPKNRSRLLNFPEKVFARGLGKTKPHSTVLSREVALAIAILLVCPLRSKNLAELRLDRHVQRPGDGRVFVVIEDDETKNRRPLEFELPKDVVSLLDAHLKTRCPYMCPVGTPYLFPTRNGANSVIPNVLGTRISKQLLKETGLEVNAHLFRHFAVMNWLDANPGGYEVARRLLGHSDVSHTINMYSGLEVKSATRAFSDLIGELKEA